MKKKERFLSMTFLKMSYPLSSRLARILGSQSELLDVATLALQMADAYENKACAMRELFSDLHGTVHTGTLYRILHDLIKHDSAVRDVLTTGHLAKALVRMDLLRGESDARIGGIPHPLFDEISQVERREYFERSGILVIDGDVLKIDGITEILKRERDKVHSYNQHK